METVLDTSVYEYVKSNSRFLGYLYYVENEKEIASHKKNLEAKHKHSNHIVYGYRINENQFGYFDGDEP